MLAALAGVVHDCQRGDDHEDNRDEDIGFCPFMTRCGSGVCIAAANTTLISVAHAETIPLQIRLRDRRGDTLAVSI